MRPSPTIMRWVGVPWASLVMAGTAAAQQQPAELVVINAKVITVDTQRPQATAFAVQDGTFVAVGTDAEMAAHRGTQTRVIDAGGHTVISGLNDSHAHVVRGGHFQTPPDCVVKWQPADIVDVVLQLVVPQWAVSRREITG